MTTQTQPFERYVSQREMAAILHVSQKKFCEIAETIPHLIVGSRRRYNLKEVTKFLAKKEEKTAA